MKEGIIDELRDSGRLIIIDEANQLNHKALEAIRALHDKGNMGIVLAGNSIIYERINSRNDTLYAQIVCRIGIRKHIFGKIAKSDIESLFEQKKLSTRCTDYLHQLANGKGIKSIYWLKRQQDLTKRKWM